MQQNMYTVRCTKQETIINKEDPAFLLAMKSISRCSHPPGTLEVNIYKVFTCHAERRKNKRKISEVGGTTILSEVVR
jgi:hypothetical protein